MQISKPLAYGSEAFSTQLNTTAERIAERVKGRVGFSVITLITILSTVLPFLSQLPCFASTEKRDGVATAMKKSPSKTVQQTANKIKRSARRRNHVKLTPAEAREMAQASIDECLETDDATVAGFCQSCRGVADDDDE